MLSSLVELQPRAPAAPQPGTLGEMLRTALPLVHPGSLVLTISDFSGVEEDLDPRWLTLGAHADCRLYWITDALEEHGLPDGRYRGGVPGRVRPLDGAAARRGWTDAWRTRARRVQALAERLQGQPIRLDTGERVEEALPPLLRAAPFAA